ncbi:response regulator transcription factor [uncultured Microbulbifer sp.]|uniref:response regulator transcription factor n=1 Tax=uncultured Microbulbifer sp. TaxID=348147 RepID=UPI0026247379|nr:helix-turn-helix transcriptional regulator [uncultured Microbulbifer sp.]
MLGSGLGVLIAGQRGAELPAKAPQAGKQEASSVGESSRMPASVTTLMPRAHEAAQLAGALFTARERQVLSLVAGGATSVEIAKHLNISVHTVKNHRKNLLRKAGCRNAGQLITKCSAMGMI